MGRIIVDVMLRPGVRDVQGEAVGTSLSRRGFPEFSEVGRGSRFVLTVDGPVTDEHLERARAAAHEVLANPVTEVVVAVTAEREVAPGARGKARSSKTSRSATSRVASGRGVKKLPPPGGVATAAEEPAAEESTRNGAVSRQGTATSTPATPNASARTSGGQKVPPRNSGAQKSSPEKPRGQKSKATAGQGGVKARAARGNGAS